MESLETNLQSDQILMAGGKAASTKCPAFHLIPTVFFKRLAERFELGLAKKKEKSWNALSNNQEVLLDKDFVIERISHLISHALKLRDKIAANDMNGIKEDDDAAAISWAGAFLVSSTDAMLKQASTSANKPNNSL